jgi:hypothetical protein
VVLGDGDEFGAGAELLGAGVVAADQQAGCGLNFPVDIQTNIPVNNSQFRSILFSLFSPTWLVASPFFAAIPSC